MPPDHSPSGPPRPLRKDAQRTRRLVLDAADELFATRGIDVGFDEIARTAGVGVGTVYRRFPRREDLVEALFVEKIEQLVAMAHEASTDEDPWQGMVAFCERSIAHLRMDRGLAQVVAGQGGREAMTATRDEVDQSLTVLLERCQAAGVVRPDVVPADIALLSIWVSRVGPTSDDLSWRRYLALLLDAIRDRPDNAPLPGPVPSLDSFDDIALGL